MSAELDLSSLKLSPLSFAEAYQDELSSVKDGTLDQHPVCGERLQLFILAHRRDTIFKEPRPIRFTRGVKERLERSL